MADAAGQVSPDGKRHTPGGDERRIPATAPTRTPCGIGRVNGPSPDGIVGLVEVERLGHVPLPDDNRSGGLQSSHDSRVVPVERRRPATNPEGCDQPADGKALLDAHRHAGQRPGWRVGEPGSIRDRLGAAGLHESIETGVGVAATIDRLRDNVHRIDGSTGYLGDDSCHGLPMIRLAHPIKLRRDERAVDQNEPGSTASSAALPTAGSVSISTAQIVSDSPRTPTTMTASPGWAMGALRVRNDSP